MAAAVTTHYRDDACAHSPAAADVGNGDHAAQMTHEHRATDAERRRDGDVEAAVAIDQHRVRAVQGDVLKQRGVPGDVLKQRGVQRDVMKQRAIQNRESSKVMS